MFSKNTTEAWNTKIIEQVKIIRNDFLFETGEYIPHFHTEFQVLHAKSRDH